MSAANADVVQLASVRAALMALAAASYTAPNAFAVARPGPAQAAPLRASARTQLRGGAHRAADGAAPQGAAALQGVAAGAVALAALSSSRRAGKATSRGAGAVVVRAASSDSAPATTATDTSIEEAKAAAEAAKLALEAAQLRAEAEEMERANKARRRALRAQEILGDKKTSGVTAVDLRAQMKEVMDMEITEEQAKFLVTACKPGEAEAALKEEDLAGEAFDEALSKIVAQVQETKRLEAIATAEREAKEAEERRKNEPEPVVWTGEENDDRGFGTRVVAALAYLLPLVDGLQFGLPLLQVAPFLFPFFAILSIPSTILNAIPFGTLILFIIMSALSNNRELPRLVRFNLQQAVLLDIFLFIPSILTGLFSMVAGGTGGAAAAINLGIFILLILAVGYSVIFTLGGKDPDGLPFVSQATKRSIDGGPR